MTDQEKYYRKKYGWIMHIISLGITLIVKIIKEKREKKLKD